jgi:hypothetical protein
MLICYLLFNFSYICASVKDYLDCQLHFKKTVDTCECTGVLFLLAKPYFA